MNSELQGEIKKLKKEKEEELKNKEMYSEKEQIYLDMARKSKTRISPTDNESKIEALEEFIKMQKSQIQEKEKEHTIKIGQLNLRFSELSDEYLKCKGDIEKKNELDIKYEKA